MLISYHYSGTDKPNIHPYPLAKLMRRRYMEHKQSLLAHLYTFSVVAKFLSFTLAAEELCLTQGAVSQRIKNLKKIWASSYLFALLAN